MSVTRTSLLPRSIRMQTLLISLGPAVVIALMLTGYLAHNQVQYQERELEQTGQLIASQLAPAAEYGVLTGNRALLQDLVEGSMQRVPSLYSIEIHDSEGQVLARVRQEDQPGELTRPFVAVIYREQVALDEHFLGASQSEPLTPIRLGELQVRMTRTALKERQQDTLLNAAGFAGIALLITAMVAIALAHSLSRPLRAMGSALRRIEDGDYHSPLAEQGPGELGDLARHINQLAGALEQAEQQQERNIRALTAARIEAEQANQAKSSFLAMMSHELRTPLNGVFGMLQLLATTRQTSEQSEYTQLAMESTDHLLNVINDILDLSRIERGSLQLEAIPFKPHELIRRTVEAFRPSAEQKQLALELHLPAELAPMETIGDPTRLRQILVNLIGNAIKFTATGSISVEISLPERDQQRLVLRCLVRDTGIGIAPEQMQRMFQAFEQADTSTSRCYGGTGLGLTIARDLAERMGGMLNADSQPGSGSTFRLELPLIWRPARRNPSSDSTTLPRGDNRTLLLVEDDPVNRFVIKSLLEQQGFRVEHAGDGQQALALVEHTRYDAILMDCQLPLIDGLEVTRRIRAGLGPNRDTPIIALTANAQRDNRQACLLAGMNDYLSKPVRLSDVQTALDCWLGTRP